MIPKVIHYCWFGRNPLPNSAVKCIESWRRFMPDYEIKEWNEDSFDVNMIRYTREAYSIKKYAFVSDYARYWVLYNFGGVYFDTDVEVVKTVDELLDKGAFFGAEIDAVVAESLPPIVNPGLCMASEAGHEMYGEMLETYSQSHFICEDGGINMEAIVRLTTKALIERGLSSVEGVQRVAGINIYPKEYFNPYNNNTGVMSRTPNTYTIHWYDMSWVEKRNLLRHKILQFIHRIFGEQIFSWLRR